MDVGKEAWQGNPCGGQPEQQPVSNGGRQALFFYPALVEIKNPGRAGIFRLVGRCNGESQGDTVMVLPLYLSR